LKQTSYHINLKTCFVRSLNGRHVLNYFVVLTFFLHAPMRPAIMVCTCLDKTRMYLSLSFFPSFSLFLFLSLALWNSHTLFFSSIHYSPPSVKHTPTHPFSLPLSISLSLKVLSFLAITTLFRSASQVERQVIVLAGLGNNCSLNSSSKEIHFCSVFHVSSSNRCWSTVVFIQYS